MSDPVVEAFHKKLYGHPGRAQIGATWLGVKTSKIPSDLWLYQELIVRVRPSWIIELGTACGGSALYFATICEAIGHGLVISVDAEERSIATATRDASHRRICYLHGSSIDPVLAEKIRRKVKGGTVFASLDSRHEAPHVLQEMRIYGEMVTKDSYMVVEDTNLDGVLQLRRNGPTEAVRRFLPTHREFQQDAIETKFLLTYHSGGWLKKVR